MNHANLPFTFLASMLFWGAAWVSCIIRPGEGQVVGFSMSTVVYHILNMTLQNIGDQTLIELPWWTDNDKTLPFAEASFN